jgi:hypothetical protein
MYAAASPYLKMSQVSLEASIYLHLHVITQTTMRQRLAKTDSMPASPLFGQLI